MKKLTFRQKDMIADIMIWGGLITLYLWIFLRLIGVIQTPLWLKLLPYGVAGLSILGITYKAGNFVGKLQKDLEFIKKQAIKTDEKLDELHQDFHTHMKKHHA